MSPVNAQFDILLNQKGYMLARGQFKGRAWRRVGLPNAVQPRQTDADARRNAQPAEVDFIATYDDFSGGFGDAYRSVYVPYGYRAYGDPFEPNRYHWAENFDARFPRQMVHAQGPRTLRGSHGVSPSGGTIGRYNTLNTWVLQVPPIDVGAGGASGQTRSSTGRGSLIIPVQRDLSGFECYTPTGLPATGSEFDRTEEGFPVANIAGRPAIFGSFAWFGVPFPAASVQFGSPKGFVRRSMSGVAGLAFTQSVMNGQVFAVAGNRLWRAATPSGPNHANILQSVAAGADPMGTANWSATLNIGNGQTDIQDMLALDDQLYVSMTDGLYAGDLSGTFPNVLGEIAGQTHPDNGRQLAIHDGGIIYPYTGGLMHYKPSSDTAQARDIGPNTNSQRSPLRGRFRAVASYAGWLYAGLYTGSNSHIYAGRDRGDGSFIWHPLQRLPLPAPINHLNVDTITTPSGGGNEASGNRYLPPRMWACTEPDIDGSIDVAAGLGGSLHTWWWPIPAGDTNPLGAPNFSGNYCGSARIDFGRDDRGAPETLKVLRRTDINTDASTFFSGSRYADVYYTLDGGARTLLGRAQQSPKTTLFFPASEGSFVTCYDFELSLESFTGSLNQTPVYRSVVTHGAFLTQGSDEITAVLDISDRRADRQGTPMRPAAMQIAELRAIAGGPPVSLVDLTGAQNFVTLQRAIEESEQYQEGSDEPEVAATVKMVIQQFTGS